MTYLDVLSIILIGIAAMLNAGMDVLYANFKGSIFKNLNPKFWDPHQSSVNKWKNGDINQGPRFFGSSTFLVQFTDGWHLLKSIMLLSLAGALTLQTSWIVGLVFISVFCGVFEIIYRNIKK